MRMLAICAMLAASVPLTAFAASDTDYTYNASTGYYTTADGTPYVRSSESWYEWVPGAYSYAGHWQNYYRYVYTRVRINPYSPNALSQLVAIKARQEADNAKLQLKSLEYSGFNSAVQMLGLNGQTLARYAFPPALPGGSEYGVLLGQQTGDTKYGYSLGTVIDYYRNVDLAAMMQSSAAQSQGVNQTLQLANDGYNRNLQVITDGMNAAAKIQAGGQADAARLRASKESVVIRKTMTSTAAPTTMPREGDGGDANARRTAAAANCVQCHSGAKLQGNYDVLKHWSLPQAEKNRIVRERLLTSDAGKLMPRDEKGVGYQLDPRFIAVFLE